MKKILMLLPVLVLCGCDGNETIKLKCDNISEPVTVTLLKDGAILNVGDQEYALTQQFEARVVYFRFDPWYNFQIGNKDFLPEYKYSLGHDVDGAAQYDGCTVVK